ncbi:MAG: polysaccharide biosynthesis tyrosine autokinase [Candidatus Sericytochromatia bacterium]|nr:polysaccharide biosynthesis tyrosine autokinase [Candidatus Sericytochromatia bacterium]
MDLKFYLGILARRWWMIVLSVILVVGSTWMRASSQPSTYAAQLRMLYEPNAIANSVLNNVGMSLPSWNNPVNTQLQLIRTRPNIETVVSRLGVPPSEVAARTDAVLAGLSAEVDRDTDIIIVRFTSSDPDYTVKVVNEVGRVFIERNKSFHQETARQTRLFIEQQLAKTEVMLNEAEAALRRFREQNKVLSVSEIGGNAAGKLAALDSETLELQLQRTLVEAKAADARRHLEVTDLGLVQRLEKLRSDPVHVALQAELARAESNIAVLLSQYKEDSTEVREAQARLERLKGAARERVTMVVGQGLDEKDLALGRTATEQKYLSELITSESELTMLAARAKALEASKGFYESRFASLPAKEQQMTQLMRQQQAAVETYNAFLRRMQEARITEAISVGNMRIIEEASKAHKSVYPLAKLMGMSLLLGLVFGVAAAVFIEFLDDRIRRPEDAESVLDLPILGMLPWVEGREAAARRLVVLEDPRSPVTESYRALQTYTRMVDPDVEHQCVLITSPGPKEGKSTVLANLAITSAQLGRRTLIIDTDLRAPSQHINFDRPNLMGLYDVVYEGLAPEEAIQPTDVDHLDILCTGPVPPDPVSTLHSDAFRRLVERLRRDYDAIFFDAPPINFFTDAAVLGRLVDSVLLVVDVRSTTRQHTLTAKDLLVKARVPLRGMVVKNMSYKMSRYHNRYFERYYMDRLKHIADE